MKVGAAKLIQASTCEDHLTFLEGMNVQLTFRPRRFYEVEHDVIKSWVDKLGINVLSIHYPSFRGIGDNFVENLSEMKEIYGTNLFTVHPKWDSLEEGVRALKEVEEEIAECDVVLAYENLPGPTGAWNCYPANVAAIEFPFTAVTYDINHLPADLDDKREMDNIMEITPIVHLSNVKYNNGRRKDHQPIDSSECDRDVMGFVEFLKKKDYNGQLIIEYMPVNSHKLREDVMKLERLVE